MKGYLALDIDGTITDIEDSIPEQVLAYLDSLVQNDWKIIILTGRSYPFAMPVLLNVSFPYILSTQNGACAWFMPRKELIFQNFLNEKILFDVEACLKGLDIVIITYGSDFKCYAKPNKRHQKYIENIFATQGGGELLESFDHEKLKSFPLIKCTGSLDAILQAKKRLDLLDIEVTLLKSPFFEDYHLLLITKKGVTKGSCISRILGLEKAKVIAAGNDGNDISMFEIADIKIAMKDSPEDLINKADIIAPPSKDLGIIQGLEEAIKRLSV